MRKLPGNKNSANAKMVRRPQNLLPGLDVHYFKQQKDDLFVISEKNNS